MSRIAAPLLACALLGASAQAQMYRDGPPPAHRVVYRDLSVFRLNPLGLISDARIAYRFRLYESQSLALRDNFVSVGLAPVLSGGFARIGPIIEVQPLTILQLWALYEWVGYFGAFNFMQSYASASSDYRDTELKRRGALPDADPLKNYSTTGTQLMLGANLQLKVGRWRCAASSAPRGRTSTCARATASSTTSSTTCSWATKAGSSTTTSTCSTSTTAA